MERRPRRKRNNQEKALGWDWGYVRPGRGLGAERRMGVGNVRGKALVRGAAVDFLLGQEGALGEARARE